MMRIQDSIVGQTPSDVAEKRLRNVIDFAPDNATARSDLGLLLATSGHLDEAEQCLRKAVLLDADTIAFQFNLANFLAASHRDEDREEAKSLFLAVIKSEPQHLEAWNNLGTLLFETGYTSAANTAFAAVIAFHPDQTVGHVNLANIRLQMDQLDVAEKHYQIALDLAPDLVDAHRGLANIYRKRGNEEKACYHCDKGFANHHVVTLPHRGRSKPAQLLVLSSALDGNTPWRLLIDSMVFETTFVAVEYVDSQFVLPAHQLVFNAIGDADLCPNGLEIANRLIQGSNAPIINHPRAVQQSGRLMNARRLAALKGVTTPHIDLISKADCHSGRMAEMLAHKELTPPFLLRAPGFHGGNHFVRVDSRDELSNAVDAMPGENVFVIEYLDAHSEDSLFRKYRIMSIDGSFYPVHMAISTQWKVHYFSSDMEKDDDYRKEEEAFLNDYSTYLGADAVSALQKIADTQKLDYFGMDFGIDKQNGNILLYEANSTMIISPPTHDKRWDYRRTAIGNALGAGRKMFAEKVLV